MTENIFSTLTIISKRKELKNMKWKRPEIKVQSLRELSLKIMKSSRSTSCMVCGGCGWFWSVV